MGPFQRTSRCIRAFTFCAVFALLMGAPSEAQPAALSWSDSLRVALKGDLQTYLRARGALERISCASLSISFPSSRTTLDVVSGRTQYGGGDSIVAQTMFQIGSNTKSFTAATLLQLEAEGHLHIDDTVGRWLPQYPRYAKATIRKLLNMTSGIQTYDATPAWMRQYAAAPTARMTPEQLIAFVNGWPLEPGWNYSNTNYELAQLIIEKITRNSYASEIERRFFKPLRMDDTFYNGNLTPPRVTSRMPAGYFYSHDPDNAGLAPLLGKDMRSLSLSWAQAAGAVISTPADLTRWVRGLYEGGVLAPKQRSELLSLVANDTGLPVAAASAKHPKAFGLGVGQAYQPSVGGVVWYYEGETLGYRMIYGLFPSSNVIIAIGLNSQPNAKDDAIGALLESVYATLRAAHRV
jgi:D-alanyl-D-alanine carboxypeptidase